MTLVEQFFTIITDVHDPESNKLPMSWYEVIRGIRIMAGRDMPRGWE